MQVTAAAQDESVFIGLPNVFRRLETRQRAALAEHAEVRFLQRNEVLIAHGEPGPRAFALRAGILTMGYPTGASQIVVTEFFTPHDVHTSLRPPASPTPFQVRSVGRSAVVCWPLAVFNDVLARNAEFCFWYLEQSKRRIETLQSQRARMHVLDLEARYAYFLWSIAEQSRDGRREVAVKIPQQTVASYLGVSREEVSRKKQLLEKAGFIEETPNGLALSPRLPCLFSLGEDCLLPWEPD